LLRVQAAQRRSCPSLRSLEKELRIPDGDAINENMVRGA
jgi:hypothetical protein